MYKKILKNLTPNAFLVIGCILAGCIFLYAVGLRQSASSIGNGVGVSAGTVVGKAIGSWEGLTKGSSEGEKAGREEGLSAEDTLISISNRIHQMEKLEVLAADVKLKNFHTIGKQQDYAALYLASGNVVFTVDLSRAKTSQQGNTFKIMLPDPEAQLYIDDASVKKVAEYQKRFFTGDAESGFDAYLNSMKQMQKVSRETLSNYDSLAESAKAAAIHQVEMLAGSMSDAETEIIVEIE